MNIINAATAYLYKYNLFGKEWRYDSISIVGTPETSHTLEHYKNITNVLDKFDHSNKNRYKKKNNARRTAGCRR